MTAATKGMDVPDGADQRCRGDDTHTGDLMESTGHGMLANHSSQLLVDRGDPFLKVAHFFEDGGYHVAYDVRQRDRQVFEEGGNPRQCRPRAVAKSGIQIPAGSPASH
jgi:hypothetical protein